MTEEKSRSWADRQINLSKEVYDTIHDGVIRRQKDRPWQGEVTMKALLLPPGSDTIC